MVSEEKGQAGAELMLFLHSGGVFSKENLLSCSSHPGWDVASAWNSLLMGEGANLISWPRAQRAQGDRNVAANINSSSEL